MFDTCLAHSVSLQEKCVYINHTHVGPFLLLQLKIIESQAASRAKDLEKQKGLVASEKSARQAADAAMAKVEKEMDELK